MKNPTFLLSVLLLFVAEIAALMIYAFSNTDDMLDTILVNEAVWSVQADWNHMETHENQTGLDYVVLDMDGDVCFRTKPGLRESISMAVAHRDTILDIQADGRVVGKILIANSSAQDFAVRRRATILVLIAAISVQCLLCIGYILYVNHTIQKPFLKLKGFAQRIAGGNLDIPLEMDRRNLFGAFTEGFDIMRCELKKARQAEAKANADKKELVAKLSHDIKTPVASIKAASEVGAALTDDEKIRDNYMQIIRKSDQINTLITNLFTATLEELEQLSVSPEDIRSAELKTLLENADYLHRAVIPKVPDCMLYADCLRLQQVFDNLFANSYKYANTDITLSICRSGRYLAVGIEDYGGGADKEELPLLKEKFQRGSRAKQTEGAGLGLYISDYFMKEMHGELLIENGKNGFKATVNIVLSGII